MRKEYFNVQKIGTRMVFQMEGHLEYHGGAFSLASVHLTVSHLETLEVEVQCFAWQLCYCCVCLNG